MREGQAGRFDTLSPPMPVDGRDKSRGTTLDRVRALERFLAGIERRAFRIACIALRDRAEAEDAVQDAMMRLVRAYGRRPEDEWRPLFYRILRNRITDSQRRARVRRAFMAFRSATEPEEPEAQPMDRAADPGGGPEEQLEGEQLLARVEAALAGISARQREAFLLRNFEGLDVAQTAVAMGCSEGSVKTHYSRAVQALEEALGVSGS
jgi:RNA polymerase sigma-70 factor (ECF subfamily)